MPWPFWVPDVAHPWSSQATRFPTIPASLRVEPPATATSNLASPYPACTAYRMQSEGEGAFAASSSSIALLASHNSGSTTNSNVFTPPATAGRRVSALPTRRPGRSTTHRYCMDLTKPESCSIAFRELPPRRNRRNHDDDPKNDSSTRTRFHRRKTEARPGRSPISIPCVLSLLTYDRRINKEARSPIAIRKID